MGAYLDHSSARGSKKVMESQFDIPLESGLTKLFNLQRNAAFDLEIRFFDFPNISQ